MSIDEQIVEALAEELELDPRHVAATIKLLDAGDTVPFIARYRKEVTGEMSDVKLRELETRLTYLRELEERKQVILHAIEQQGKLTEELATAIRGVTTKARLEDLYLPYKTTRRTKATIAREAGLEPLVDSVLAGDIPTSIEDIASSYITEGFTDATAVIAGARDIMVERLSTNAEVLGKVRGTFFSRGTVHAGVVEGKEEEGQKFSDYFDYTGSYRDLPSHRILALLRGEREGVLRLDFTGGESDEFYEALIAELADLQSRGDKADSFRADCVRYAWRTKIAVSSAVDTRVRLKEFADEQATEVFAKNLKDILLAAPAGHRVTLALDPGYRNGVKCAVLGEQGRVRDTRIVYPHTSSTGWEEASKELSLLCVQYRVRLIAIGNGIGSRETEKLAQEVADLVQSVGRSRPQPVVVSEAGASIYSASPVAAAELPELDVSLRGAVSIGRRLQDPLAELVKIEPKSIGVGQYQHDVNQTQLARTLDAVVEDAVNSVGVNLNTASVQLLERVAGITTTIAKNIVAYRDDNERFSSRDQLLKVPRLGPKAFEQAAGFLRIRNGMNPLDASAVHPEAYPLVHRISKIIGVDVKKMVGNMHLVRRLRAEDFADDKYGLPTVRDVLQELEKPGRDPRPEFRSARLKDGLEQISDLRPGMILEGTVTNVAAFGAFVDVGLMHEGLVHISEMSDDYITDPHDVVSSGQVIKVRVVSVDQRRNRYSLSMVLSEDSASGRSGSRGGSHGTGDAGKRSNREASGYSDNRGRARNTGGYTSSRGNPGHTSRGNRGAGGKRHGQPRGGGSMADALRRAGFGE